MVLPCSDLAISFSVMQIARQRPPGRKVSPQRIFSPQLDWFLFLSPLSSIHFAVVCLRRFGVSVLASSSQRLFHVSLHMVAIKASHILWDSKPRTPSPSPIAPTALAPRNASPFPGQAGTPGTDSTLLISSPKSLAWTTFSTHTFLLSLPFPFIQASPTLLPFSSCRRQSSLSLLCCAARTALKPALDRIQPISTSTLHLLKQHSITFASYPP